MTPQEDYVQALAEVGMSETLARAISENERDQIPLPAPYPVQISASRIQGLGVFARSHFYPGSLIAPARINGMRTPVGRYANHSPTPNAMMKVTPAGFDLIAVTQISAGEEITVNYRDVYRANRASAPVDTSSLILAELVRLNKSMQEILCLQKLQGMRDAARSVGHSGVGSSPADAQLGGEDRLLSCRVRNDATD